MINFKYSYILYSYLLVSLIVNARPYNFLLGENGFLEISQILCLIFAIFLNIKFRKTLINKFSNSIFYLKSFFLVLIVYEELSIITTEMFGFLGNINNQAELNFHNASILTRPLISLNIFNNDIIHFIPLTFITLGFLLIIAFGSYIKLFKRFSFLFLDKRFSLYILIYPLNFILSYFLRPFWEMQNGFLINQEFVELFFYMIFLFDTILKINQANKNI